jgi:hypothetical protein
MAYLNAKKGAQQQPHFVHGTDGWSRAQGIEFLRGDAVEDGAATEPGETDFEAQGKGQRSGEGTTLVE